MSRRVKLNRKLPALVAKLPQVQADLFNVAKDVAKDAKRRVPRDTGALADSVHAEKRDGGAVVVMGDEDAFYASFIEFGSARNSAKAPLRRAAEAAGTYRKSRR